MQAGAVLFALAACATAQEDKSIFTFTDLVSIEGKPASLATYTGNVSLMINVASFCGETKSSYEDISAFRTMFASEPFVVLGFPANQWMSQEPHSNAVIQKFVDGSGEHKCGRIYCNWNGQAVPPLVLFAKTNVKEPWCKGPAATDCAATSEKCCAPNQAPWQWLKTANSSSYPPGWNWQGKHLFDKCGKLRFSPGPKATVASLAPLIKQLLAENPQC